jgi:hypothetical protein
VFDCFFRVTGLQIEAAQQVAGEHEIGFQTDSFGCRI